MPFCACALCDSSVVEDIDLFAGGMSENPILGGLIGPTFACVIATDFHLKKFGDRYYYERDDPVFAFSEGKLTPYPSLHRII